MFIRYIYDDKGHDTATFAARGVRHKDGKLIYYKTMKGKLVRLNAAFWQRYPSVQAVECDYFFKGVQNARVDRPGS